MLARFAEADAAVVGHGVRPAARGALDVGEVRAADARGHRPEAHLGDLGAQPERLQHLGAAIARHARDAHLRHDLEQPRFERLAIPRGGFVAHGRKRQVRMDGRCTDRDQAGDVVNVDRVAGDGDYVGGHPTSSGKQMRMHGPDGERHRHGDPLQRGAAIAQCDHAGDLVCLTAQARQRVAQRFVRRIGGVEDGRGFQDARQLGRTQHRRLELQELVILPIHGEVARSAGGAWHRGVMPAKQLAVRPALRLERAMPGPQEDAQ